MNTASVHAHARRLVHRLAERNMTVATAESCTGGLIAKLITDIPGSSSVFPGGCVTYTNPVKEQLLGVSPDLIACHTEVSTACAEAMAQGIRIRLCADVGISTTGFAGPGGGTEKDPVGTVYIGVSTVARTFSERFCAPVGSTRAQVRNAAANRALELVLQAVQRMTESCKQEDRIKPPHR